MLGVNEVEEVFSHTDEWLSVADVANITELDKNDAREILRALVEAGLINQKAQKMGRYHRYLYRRAPLVCPHCGKGIL